jgi:hypothetical protein
MPIFDEYSPDHPDARITITQGKYVKYLTYMCNLCDQKHSVAVRQDGERVPLAFRSAYWRWNGNYVNPTLYDDCVHMECGHNYIRGGSFYRRQRPAVRMMKVSAWPKPKRPPNKFERIIYYPFKCLRETYRYFFDKQLTWDEKTIVTMMLLIAGTVVFGVSVGLSLLIKHKLGL